MNVYRLNGDVPLAAMMMARVRIQADGASSKAAEQHKIDVTIELLKASITLIPS